MCVHDYRFELVDHPPHSPDLTLSDYFMFPNMKNTCLGSSTDNETISSVDDLFEDQDESFYIYHGNPSAATPVEEVCGQQGRLC